VELKKLGLRLSVGPEGSLLAQLKIRSVLRDKVLVAQQVDEKSKGYHGECKPGYRESIPNVIWWANSYG
jgi:hypothetical protein